jgi:hypothetical protein
MSDYDPNFRRHIDRGPNRYGEYQYSDAGGEGRPGLVLLAVLAGVALVGGLLYFGNPQNSTTPDQAQRPPVQEQQEPPAIPAPAPALPPATRPEEKE